MKYIVDTDDFEPLFDVDSIGVFGIGKSLSDSDEDHSWSRIKSVGEFEELNADYVNEHFGVLQDDAYNAGFEEGKKEAESSEAIEQAKADAFNKGMLFKEEKINDAFKRGFEKGKAVNDKGCEGCKLQGTDSNICDQCCNSYANQWKSKDDKIEVGDEVIYNGTTKCIVVRPEDDERYASLIDSDGTHYSADHRECKKTGRHFDIDKILEGLRYDG